MIFLNRKGSSQPFERVLPPNLLHCLSANPSDFHVEVRRNTNTITCQNSQDEGAEVAPLHDPLSEPISIRHVSIRTVFYPNQQSYVICLSPRPRPSPNPTQSSPSGPHLTRTSGRNSVHSRCDSLKYYTTARKATSGFVHLWSPCEDRNARSTSERPPPERLGPRLGPHAQALPEAAPLLRRAVLQLQEAEIANLLLRVEFETVFEYLLVRRYSRVRSGSSNGPRVRHARSEASEE